MPLKTNGQAEPGSVFTGDQQRLLSRIAVTNEPANDEVGGHYARKLVFMADGREILTQYCKTVEGSHDAENTARHLLRQIRDLKKRGGG